MLYKSVSYFYKETAIKCFEFSETESMPFLIEQLTGRLLELTFPVSFCIVPNVSEQRNYKTMK